MKTLLSIAVNVALQLAAYATQVVTGCNGGFNSDDAAALHYKWFK